MKLASVELIKNKYPHPNADRVEFVEVLGFKCIVPKDTYEVGQPVILIQPDTVLPDTEWAAPYKKRSKRVKALKFRGEWSFGIVEKLDILGEEGNVQEGLDVTEILGVTKYVAPVPQQLNAKGRLPHGLGKTDETTYQNLNLDDLWGTEVDVTLKIDGQSCTFYFKRGKNGEEDQFGVTGRTLELKPDSQNNYTAHIDRYDIENKMRDFCYKHEVDIAIRGESYGKGIQGHKANPHAKRDKGFAMFSVYNLTTLRYERIDSPLYFYNVAADLNIPHVEVLELGVVLTPELIKKYAEDMKTLPNGDKFEGVVINHPKGSFKVINLHYDSKK